MSKVVTLSPADQRLENASRWVLKMDAGLTEPEWQGLKDWLTEHPDNASELMEVASAWDKLDSLSRLADLFPHEHTSHASAARDPVVEEPMVQDPARPVLWQRPAFLAAAASLVLAVSAAYLLLPGLDMQDLGDDRPLVAASPPKSYETAIGEQSTVVLPDGTVVILNTNSRLGVAYSAAARVLHLQRGEIHVSVAKDSSRRLSVVVGDQILQAVGTAFSVEITENSQIELVVTEGKVVVGVRSTGQQATVVPPILAQSDSNTVVAGEELILGVPDAVITPVTVEELEVKLSWREGRLIFRGEPLAEALAEVERYTTVEFVFLDEDLKTRSVSGRYRAGDVDALLIALRLNFNIDHEFVDDDRVLLSSL